MSIMKNIDKARVMVLKDQVSYQEGQIVSKTLVQNEAVSITLFAFDKGEEISTHESGGDAFVTCLDGTGEITIDGVKSNSTKANPSSCRQNTRMLYTAKSSIRCCWSLYSKSAPYILKYTNPNQRLRFCESLLIGIFYF